MTECSSINDLDDDVLLQIFELLINPFNPNFETSPTSRLWSKPCRLHTARADADAAAGFEYVVVLPRVCKRWKEAIEGAPRMWRFSRICCWGWPKQMSTAWWARHGHQCEGVAISGHTSWAGLDVSAFNLGLLSLLTSNLRKLRLLKCFHRSFMPNVLRALEGLRGLEELWMWGDVGYLSDAPQLAGLTRLKSLLLRRSASQQPVLHLLCIPPQAMQVRGPSATCF
ncbi:unnamed protein product [Ostreobium quekettii]|uniref:F-box domain-containing protein n=1 Tax=Ostreobium quekettii TaxID=121088 RepID=A0A8S1JA06_9CHLO|nr:unnamed protein product [Ostreobium quekettii]|eukprot:evm.model.scf_1221.2 EVM.evm.TU.scf_1221.2   scf_1221:25289-27469(-)